MMLHQSKRSLRCFFSAVKAGGEVPRKTGVERKFSYVAGPEVLRGKVWGLGLTRRAVWCITL